jgi:hypothetical protein
VVERTRGAGDLYLRTKWCFLENAETGFGLALLPYVTIPTGSGGMGSGSVEGGLIVPMAVGLAPELELALMLGIDGLRHETKAGYGAHWHLSAALSRTITRALGRLSGGRLDQAFGWKHCADLGRCGPDLGPG